MDAIFELFKRQRTVVERAGQAEAVLHQVFFARAVAMIHALQLRNGLMALVQEHQRIVGKIIEQRRRRLSGQASGKMARIIFDAVAITDLLDHFEIEHGALPQALPFDALAFLIEFALPPMQLVFDTAQRLVARFGTHYIMRFRIDGKAQVGLLDLPGQRIDLIERFDFIAP